MKIVLWGVTLRCHTCTEWFWTLHAIPGPSLSALKMFEDRNEKIIENVCLSVLWTLPTWSNAHIASWDILIFQNCNRIRIIALLCNSALHAAEASPFFFVKSPARWTRKTKTAWNNSWKATWYGLLHGRAAPLYVIASFSWIFSAGSEWMACLQVLLQKKWASLGLTEAVARMWRRIVFSPFLSTFLFPSCRDWTMWYFAACQANGMSHSRKEHTVILTDLAVMCIEPEWLTTMSCLWWSSALLHRSSHPYWWYWQRWLFLLFNACEPCTSLNWKNCLEHMRVSTTKYSTTLLPQTISCSTAFFSKIQERFILQSHLSQSATQGDSLLWSDNQDSAKTY